MNIKVLILSFLIIFDPMSSNAQFHKKLKEVAEMNNLIGMSVAIVHQGKITDVYHFGKSSLERNIRVNDSSMFRIASISKTITAVALMKLYERGLFKLDDDISPFLGFKVVNPNFPDKVITFRMLLSHTSSLIESEAYDKFLMTTYRQSPPPPLKELLMEGRTSYSPDLWNTKEPGSFFSYCNLNFGIIGTLIEKISGERFDIFVRKEILKPLGISGSFNVGDIENINNLSTLYRNSKAQADDYKGERPKQRDLSAYKIGDNGIIFGPQGGLRISAKDLSKFMIMLMNYGESNGSRILDSTTIAIMHSSQWKYDGTNGDNYHSLFKEWGLGFHLVTGSKNEDIIFDNIRMIGHSGDAYGLISSMFFDESRQFGFVFITNGYAGEKEYSTSENSAFYKPEADVFEVIVKYRYRKYFDKDRKKQNLSQN